MLVVKFAPGVVVSYHDGPGTQFSSSVQADWNALASPFPGLSLARAYPDFSDIDDLVRDAKRLTPSYRPPDWRACFVVQVPAGVQPAAVMRELANRPWVLFADIVELGGPPWVIPSNDAFFAVNGAWGGQTHLGPSEPWPADPVSGIAWTPGMSGIDAFDAWRRPGGDGRGVNFADVERGWTIPHSDVPALAGAPVNPVFGVLLPSSSPDAAPARSHGDAVLGIVAAGANPTGPSTANGMVGIAPGVDAVFVASVQPKPKFTGDPIAGAIHRASNRVGEGGVVLLEVTANAQKPAERNQFVFDAIQLAVAAGRVVVEAAGNGDVDLDAFRNGSGVAIFDPSVRDSGAIVVGGASPTRPFAESGNTNHGRRIDCFGWSRSVQTLGTDGADFGGTSAAAAMIAGIAVSMQGMHRAVHGTPMPPAGLRDILRRSTSAEFGTDVAYDHPVATTSTWSPRGVPDLRRIAHDAMRLPDPYLRDFLGDEGEPRLDGPFGASPDLAAAAVVGGAAADPFASGTGPSDPAPGVPVTSGDFRAALRVRNRGATDAADVVADLYRAPLSPMPRPGAWRPLGRADVGTVPAFGSASAMSPAFTIAAADAASTVSIIGVLGTRTSVPVSAAETATWPNFQWACRVLAKVAWRSTLRLGPEAIVATQLGRAYAVPFTLFGADDVRLACSCRVEAGLAGAADLWIEADALVPERFAVPPSAVISSASSTKVLVSLPPPPCPLGTGIDLAAAEGLALRLLLVPRPFRVLRRPRTIAFVQSAGGRELGRLTLIVPL